MKKGKMKILLVLALLSMAVSFSGAGVVKEAKPLTSGGQPYLLPSLLGGEIAMAEQQLNLAFDSQVNAHLEATYTLENKAKSPQTAEVMISYLSTTAGREAPVVAIDGRPLTAQTQLIPLPRDAGVIDHRGQGAENTQYDFPAMIRRAAEGIPGYVPETFRPQESYTYYRLQLTKRSTFQYPQSYVLQLHCDEAQTKLLVLERVNDSSKGNWYTLKETETDTFDVLVIGKDTLEYGLTVASHANEKGLSADAGKKYNKENQKGSTSVGGIEAVLKQEEAVTGEWFVRTMAETEDPASDIFQYETFVKSIDDLFRTGQPIVFDGDLRVGIQGNDNFLCIKRFQIPFAVGGQRILTVSQPLYSGIYEPKHDVVELSYWYELVRTDTCFGWKAYGPAQLQVKTPSAFQRNVRSWWLSGMPSIYQTNAGEYMLQFNPEERKQLEITLYMDIPQWQMQQLPPKSYS